MSNLLHRRRRGRGSGNLLDVGLRFDVGHHRVVWHLLVGCVRFVVNRGLLLVGCVLLKKWLGSAQVAQEHTMQAHSKYLHRGRVLRLHGTAGLPHRRRRARIRTAIRDVARVLCNELQQESCNLLVPSAFSF